MKREFPEAHLTRVSEKRWTCRGVRCNQVHAFPWIPSMTWNMALQNLYEVNSTALKQPWVPANHKRDIFILYISSKVPH
eukprot:2363776-Amphidinium_carterae.1